MTSSSATHVTTLGSRAYDPWVHIFVQPGCTNKLLPAHGFVDSTTKGPLPDAPRSISGIQPFAIVVCRSRPPTLHTILYLLLFAI